MKQLLIWLAILGSGLVTIPTLIWPGWQRGWKLSTEVSQVDRRVADLREKMTSLGKIEIDNFAKYHDDLKAVVVPEADAYYLLSLIKVLGRDFGYRVVQYSFGLGKISDETGATGEGGSSKVALSGARPVRLALKMDGPAENYWDYVEALEKMLPLISIQDMKVTGGDEGVVTRKLDINIVAYYLSPSTEANTKKADINKFEVNTELMERLAEFRKVNTREIFSSSAISGENFREFDQVDPFGW